MAEKNPAAVELGRKGGKNSRKNFTPEQRREMAQRAIRARWAKRDAQRGDNSGERGSTHDQK